jgi:hypothetical protein
MPSSQRRIGSSVSTGWWFVTGKWDPLRFAQQVEPPIKSGTASNDSVCDAPPTHRDIQLWRYPSRLAALTPIGARTCSGSEMEP